MSALDIHPSFPSSSLESRPTFTPPLLDGNLTFPELFEYHAKHSADHPLFVYLDGESTKTITYSDISRIISRAARHIQGHFVRFQDRYISQAYARASGQGPTIGILASTDTISYFTTVLGIMRIGLVAFPISPRNSPAGVAHLISNAQVIQLFVSPDSAVQRLAADAMTLLTKESIQVELLSILQFADVSDEGTLSSQGDTFDASRCLPLEMNNLVCLLHSSGSTAFPKIIPVANRTVLHWSRIARSGEADLRGTVFAIHAAPPFHLMGLATLFLAVGMGITLAVFQPSSPPVLPTPDRFFEEALATNSNVIYAVPSLIEEWYRSHADSSEIMALPRIMYSGAPMNKAVGDELVRRGIALNALYGSTECGGITTLIPSDTPSVDKWEYFRIAPNVQVVMLPQDTGGDDDLFEPVVVDTPSWKINVINTTTPDGRPGYRTKDLLRRHPQDPTLWRVVGRADEQIMLSNGEKTNPVPLESILSRDPHIAAAVMFGRGRVQNGVLIEPRAAFAFDPSNEEKLADFRNKIWPTVEKMNEYAPAHSRLFKEMILVSKPRKPFEYTVKDTPRRPIIIQNYESEIEELYEAVRHSSQTDIEPPSSWTADETLIFIRAVVTRVMKTKVSDDLDLFLEGCDSLQATSIRNSIIHALRQTAKPSTGLPNSVVYSNPTISSLSAFVNGLLLPANEHLDAGHERKAKAQLMEALVAKYTADFLLRAPKEDVMEFGSVDAVVLITGTTGRLGSHLLAQLVSRPSVARIYALNRAGQCPLDQRQKEAFETWNIDALLLDSPKVILLEADLTAKDLGLEGAMLKQIRNSLTSVIHNAWRLDFNIGLSAFEPLISGVRNLVDLSLSSPHPTAPPILFTSSIAVFMNQASAAVVAEEPIVDASASVSGGYGEGKWVAESILLRAARDTGLRTNIVRVGQLCGSRASGGWNEKEWVGAMLRASQLMGVVPVRNDMVDWVPVDVAASTLLDMLGCSHPVLHLVHPRPVDWSIISSAASRILRTKTTPFAAWVEKLQDAYRELESNPDALKQNPALKLIDFFSNMTNPGVWSTEKAVEVSANLRTAEGLGREDVERWVAYWRSTGFLSV